MADSFESLLTDFDAVYLGPGPESVAALGFSLALNAGRPNRNNV